MQPQPPASPAQRRELCRGPEAKLDPVQGWHSPQETLRFSQGFVSITPRAVPRGWGCQEGQAQLGSGSRFFPAVLRLNSSNVLW